MKKRTIILHLCIFFFLNNFIAQDRPLGYAYFMISQANTHLNNGENEEAIIVLKDALEICKAHNAKNETISVLTTLSRSYIQLRKYKKAGAVSNEASNLIAMYPDSIQAYTKSTAYFTHGTRLFETYEYEEALDSFKLIPILLKDMYLQPVKDFGFDALAQEMLNLDFTSKDKFQEVGGLMALGYTFIYMGNIYQEFGNYEAAMDYFNQASLHFYASYVLLDRNLDYPFAYQAFIWCMTAKSRIGLACLHKNRYEDALEICQSSIDSMNINKVNNHVALGLIYETVAQVNRKTGDYKNAEKAYKKSLDILEKSDSASFVMIGYSYEESKSKIQIGLAKNYFLMNDLPKAEDLIITIQNNLEDYHTKGVNIYGQVEARLFMNIADIYYGSGKWEEALFAAEKALKILTPNMGFENGENATREFTSLDIGKALAIKAKAAYNLANQSNSKNTKKLKSSFQIYKNAIGIVENIREHLSYFSYGKSGIEGSTSDLENWTHDIFEGAIQNAFELYSLTENAEYLEEAYILSEKSKAFALRLAIWQINVFEGMPTKFLKEEKKLRNNILFYEKEWLLAQEKKNEIVSKEVFVKYFDAKQAYKTFLEKLETNPSTKKYRDLQYENRIFEPHQVQNIALNDSTALVEYFVGTSKIFVFLINDGNLNAVSFEKPTDLDEKMKQLRNVVSADNHAEVASMATYTELANELYEALFQPIITNFSNKISNLIIVPHGILHHLNFEILLTQKAKKLKHYPFYNPNTFEYLLFDYVISYANSATTLCELIKQRASKNTQRDFDFGGFAPSYEGRIDSLNKRSDRKPFPKLVDEITPISNLFDSSRVKLNFGINATESAFYHEVGKYTFGSLHILAHGVIDNEKPHYSFLQMTDLGDKNSRVDNKIEVAELYNLTIQADLAVLSACDTGYGEQFKSGEGVVCLARGFSFAGCSSVVMSLWSIGDVATANLMTLFYDNLSKGLPVNIALTKAKRDFIKKAARNKERSPFYWGGMIASGCNVRVR